MTDDVHPADPERFENAIRRFDEENGRDPNQVTQAGAARPRELAHSEWLTDWVLRLCPGASEELRLAARCQHLCRWQIPRNSYPMTRAGYLRWREELRRFHARRAGQILAEAGYPAGVIARVQALNLKSGFPADPETRTLEDALCLVFLDHQLGELANKAEEEKVINALRKSWKKMTPAAQAFALKLDFPPREKSLIERALG